MADADIDKPRLPMSIYLVIGVLAVIGLFSIWGLVMGAIFTVAKLVLYGLIALALLMVLKFIFWGRSDKTARSDT